MSACSIGQRKQALINLAKNGTRVLIAAPDANQEIRVEFLYAGALAAGGVTFVDSDGTALTGIIPVGIATQIVMGPGDELHPVLIVTKATGLSVTLTADVDLDGIFVYRLGTYDLD